MQISRVPLTIAGLPRGYVISGTKPACNLALICPTKKRGPTVRVEAISLIFNLALVLRYRDGRQNAAYKADSWVHARGRSTWDWLTTKGMRHISSVGYPVGQPSGLSGIAKNRPERDGGRRSAPDPTISRRG
jgi:hypothetical protein